MVVVKLCSLLSSIVSIEGAAVACSASTFADTSCFAGQSYDSSAAATTCADATDGCVYDDTALGTADQDICCNVNTGQKCSDFVSDGLCGASLTDRKVSTNKCIGTDSCDFDLTYDKQSCCKATTGQKCSLALPKDGWCTPGTTYDTAKKNFKCVGALCDKTVLDDQNSCCSKTKGTVTCKAGFGDDGMCSSSIPGLTYKKASADLMCVGLCDAEKLDDTNTCCMPTAGLMCSKASIVPGMCGAGLEYDVKKKNNKCVDKDACDFANPDDVNACCSSMKGAAKCGDAKGGAMTKGFCGPDMTYDVSRVTKACSGASCSKSNKDDIKTCCKANFGDGLCKSMTEASFCGAGKSLDPAKLESSCSSGKTCANNADDVGTCCMDNAGASCSDVKNGATEPQFCGTGNTFNSGSGKCEKPKCSAGSSGDKLTCCKGNDGDVCSKITAVTTFCGTGKVIDTAKEGHKCASSKCSPASVEDVAVCCKTAPKTTVVTTKAPKKNVTTPGTTGSAHANLVGTASLLFLGCLSQLM